MSPTNIPFLNIALSLSGGGYRAAAFHFGTLKLLNEIGILENVRVLSTVSGGTITGVFYAASKAGGLSFETFSSEFYGFLNSTNVITDALKGLSASKQINQTETMPSLIRSAANIYETFPPIKNKTFDLLLNSTNLHLQEISFNATDFCTGNCFRFQKSNSLFVRSGNNKSEVKPELNKLIRLSDIIAASSCFPSGFEPLRFPSDFVWTEKSISDIRKDLGANFIEDIPLMDGGVFDNQGIDSIININSRKNQEIDLFIVSDTDQRSSVLLHFPAAEKKGKLKLKHLYYLIVLIQLAALITGSAIIKEAWSNYSNQTLTIFNIIFLYLIPLFFSAAVFFLIRWGRSYAVGAEKKFKDESSIEIWKYFKNLTIPEIIYLAMSRLNSLIVMSSSVFMKRIRDLGYIQIFANTGINSKIVPNQIYDLDKTFAFPAKWSKVIKKEELTPSESLRKVARKAESYQTNLWFLDKSDLDNLILCGKATICVKLLQYFLKKRFDQLEIPDSPESVLFAKVLDMWRTLNK